MTHKPFVIELKDNHGHARGYLQHNNYKNEIGAATHYATQAEAEQVRNRAARTLLIPKKHALEVTLDLRVWRAMFAEANYD